MLLTRLLASFLLTVSGAHAPESGNVRVLDAALAQSLHDSYFVSPTVRSLVDELDRSDLIVHVIPMRSDDRARFVGTLHFVVTAGHRRYLRITIEERLSPDRRAAIIGHELQHAVEVSRAASVVDVKSFDAFYRRIGDESARHANVECYETEGARRAGERVLSELRDARIAARTFMPRINTTWIPVSALATMSGPEERR